MFWECRNICTCQKVAQLLIFYLALRSFRRCLMPFLAHRANDLDGATSIGLWPAPIVTVSTAPLTVLSNSAWYGENPKAGTGCTQPTLTLRSTGTYGDY